jgi:hypothetical protein
MRIAPLVSKRALDCIRPCLISLIIYRKHPPVRTGRIDWQSVSDACGLEGELTAALKKNLQPGLEAITRWIDNEQSKGLVRPASTEKATVAAGASRLSSEQPKKAFQTHATGPSRAKAKTGVPPKPVEEFPKPLFDWQGDPQDFQQALIYHMRRHGDSYWHLYRAVVGEHEAFDHGTLLTWVNGKKVPRSLNSFEILSRIERRYRLPSGYFKSKLPHQSRSGSGHDVGSDITPTERRRLAWHLPDDFNSLPFGKREEILEWVRRVIISGSTDYRRFQAATIKQRYAIRFPGVSYGGTLSPRADSGSDGASDHQTIEDPDLLTGVVDVPPRLAMEMANLIRFKTATLTTLGFQRNGVWGEKTASQKIEHLGLMFGALAASPKSAVKGFGVPLHQLTFGLLVFPGIWDWYLQWRERRRGFYTKWEEDMLTVLLSMVRPETGWMWQHPELIQNVKPIPGLITAPEIAAAQKDWRAVCEVCFKHASQRCKEIQRVARVHRDPFEPIMCILEADSPLFEYRKITDEIVKRMPDEDRYPRAAAEAVRSFLMLRLGLHLALRQKNLRQLLVCPRGHFPTSERRLEDMKRGEIRWSERDHGWEILIPSAAFKNANSSFFGSKPFRLVLPDLQDLYKYLNAYIERHRGALLAGAEDPGTLFVKTVKTTSKDASYDQTTFYEAWRLAIQRYGIYNPYTGRGAIKGLLPHGPHNVRDVLATHILKQTGSYEQASYAIQDTPEMVANHYGRFLPQDKAALAARILNEVWEAA